MTKVDVLVLGAGLSGLSTARHLSRSGKKVLVVEKEKSVGGRAGTVKKDGFLFDHTGHLLHLHDPYGKKFITSLLKGNLAQHRRSAWIYSEKVFTRYPYQANTFGLPWKSVEDCVVGFLKNLHRPPILPADPSFKTWAMATFGKGICDRFMYPYNEKLWRTDLAKLTTHWQGRFLPKPKPSEVLCGALGVGDNALGYNTTFLYPIKGGIQSLPDALAALVPDVQLDRAALEVDFENKVAVIDGIGEVRYQRLVNTIPLADLLDLASSLPSAVRSARAKLKWVSVYNLNLGIARPNVSDKHWIYFPEKKFPFYRVGFNTNFSKNVAPKGHSSMYIEVSRRPEETVDLEKLEKQCIQGLKSAGILKASDKIATKLWIPISCAYVVYDLERERALRTIFPYLKKNGVESIGRWGAWKYSFMEEAVLDGKRCAERILGRAGRHAESHAPLRALALK